MERGSKPESRTVSGRILTTVAEAEGVSPLSLRPLAEVVDPDDLDTLVTSSSQPDLRLQLEYEGYTVVVDERDEVALSETHEHLGR